MEDKPSNWESIRALILDAYDPRAETRDRFWENLLVYKIFLELNPELKEWLQLDISTTGATGKASVKKGNKKPPSRKEEIQRRVEEDIIRKEVQTIRIDPRTMQPIRTHFDMQVSFLLLLILWNFTLIKKQRVPQSLVLDAVISFNRLYDTEVPLIGNEEVRVAMGRIHKIVNRLIDRRMYEVLFTHPILLVECMAQRRGRPKRLYPEQKNLIGQITEAVVEDRPLLLGNQMPTGTGKTFLAVPLAKKISHMGLGKTVLFTCSNELVNRDVASTALLADGLHLWLAKLILQDGMSRPTVLLRPYKRCFPATWKKVYKTDTSAKIGSVQEQWDFYVRATKKTPDLIVADLEASLELLKEAPGIGNPFVAYVDEFLSDDDSNRLISKMCHYLPKQSVLLSSILPQFDHIPQIVRSFCDRHHTTPVDCVRRVATADVNIACAVIDEQGYLRMPHHHARDAADVRDLVREIQINPRIRRSYPPKHVYYWSRSLDDHLAPHRLTFHEVFPDIGKITTTAVIDYAIRLLTLLVDHPEYLDAFRAYRPRLMPPPDLMRLLTDQSWCYDGKTLVITDDPFSQVYKMSDALFDKDLRWADIAAKTRQNQAARDLEIERLDRMKITRLEKERMSSEINENFSTTKLDDEYVVNSRAHFARFQTGSDDRRLVSIRAAIDLPLEFEHEFDDRINLLMAAGVGVFEKRRMSEDQRNYVMSLYDKLAFLCSGKDIVFGTNLPGLTNVFIDFSFAKDQSIPTLYQLMGRVGRMGKSYHANIILNNEASVRKILSLESNIDHSGSHLIDQWFMESG